MNQLNLTIIEVTQETELVKSFQLAAADGTPLPPFTAGAHIRVSLPGGDDRPYSLIAVGDAAALARPISYRLGVRLEETGAGGSRYMHGLEVGDTLVTTAPKNDFTLIKSAAPVVLIAGGIGITPLTSMATSLKHLGVPYQLHYCGRSQGLLAFLAALKDMHGPALTEHYDTDDSALDLKALIAGLDSTSQIYVCGPAGLIEAVRETAAARGFAKSQVHFELFAPKVSADGNGTFEVELRSTGQVFAVPADRSIVEVLEAAGVDLTYDCKRGDCGICQTTVLSGVPDHRDVILTDAERATNSVMQICVSRAKSDRLVLDI